MNDWQHRSGPFTLNEPMSSSMAAMLQIDTHSSDFSCDKTMSCSKDLDADEPQEAQQAIDQTGDGEIGLPAVSSTSLEDGFQEEVEQEKCARKPDPRKKPDLLITNLLRPGQRAKTPAEKLQRLNERKMRNRIGAGESRNRQNAAKIKFKNDYTSVLVAYAALYAGVTRLLANPSGRHLFDVALNGNFDQLPPPDTFDDMPKDALPRKKDEKGKGKAHAQVSSKTSGSTSGTNDEKGKGKARAQVGSKTSGSVSRTTSSMTLDLENPDVRTMEPLSTNDAIISMPQAKHDTVQWCQQQQQYMPAGNLSRFPAETSTPHPGSDGPTGMSADGPVPSSYDVPNNTYACTQNVPGALIVSSSPQVSFSGSPFSTSNTVSVAHTSESSPFALATNGLAPTNAMNSLGFDDIFDGDYSGMVNPLLDQADLDLFGPLVPTSDSPPY